MKKSFVIGVSASIFTAGSAFAEASPSAQLSYELNAEVGSVCGVYNASGSEIEVDFGELSETPTTTSVEQGAGSASYACNSPNGFSRSIASANGGYLFRAGTEGGDSNQIAYQMRHGGGHGLAMDWTQLTSAANADFNSGHFLNGQTGSVAFRVNGVRSTNSNANGAAHTTVFAGQYSDVVTVTVTAR
ncbi:MAG: spore coat protein U domain-containing protein [Oceanicaulis sp.]